MRVEALKTIRSAIRGRVSDRKGRWRALGIFRSVFADAACVSYGG